MLPVTKGPQHFVAGQLEFHMRILRGFNPGSNFLHRSSHYTSAVECRDEVLGVEMKAKTEIG